MNIDNQKQPQRGPNAPSARPDESGRERGSGERIAEATDEMKREAVDAGHRLRDRAADSIERQREQLAEVVRDFGAAIDRAADELDGRGETRTSEWAHALSSQLHRASDYLSQQQLRDMWHDLQSFARRRPGLAIAGLFAAGVAAARFLKASDEPSGTSGRNHFDSGDGDRDAFDDDDDEDRPAQPTSIPRPDRSSNSGGSPCANVPPHGETGAGSRANAGPIGANGPRPEGPRGDAPRGNMPLPNPNGPRPGAGEVRR